MTSEALNDSSRRPSEGGPGVSSAARATAVVRFRVAGLVRFLSHAETFRVFERACTRAGVPVQYTKGFNPHPRLSLPLPRPVGVASEDELLVARLVDEQGGRLLEDRAEWEQATKQALAGQLPGGIEILGVTLAASGVSVQPQSAEYVFPVRAEDAGLRSGLQERITNVMNRDCCVIERTSPGRKAARRIDVRLFLDSARLEDAGLVVSCLTGTAGSLRIEEIMRLFGVQMQDLAGPVRRTRVTWETTPVQNKPRREDGAEDRNEDAT